MAECVSGVIILYCMGVEIAAEPLFDWNKANEAISLALWKTLCLASEEILTKQKKLIYFSEFD